MRKFTGILLTAFIMVFAISLSAQDTTTTEPAPATTTAAGEDNAALLTRKLIDFTILDTDAANPQIQWDDWRITLSGLSDTPENLILSELKMVEVNSAEVNDDILTGEQFSISKAMGVRINFAKGYNNDWARIATEDPLSLYKIQEEEANGVLRNVGPVKSVSLVARGMNYMHSIEIRMKDQDGQFRNVNFGSLYFNGWRRITWNNPTYIQDKRKREVMKMHLYPAHKPLLFFDSIMVYKAPTEKGGDFVFYVTDVTVQYEPYFTTEINDIDNEGVWGIQKAEDDRKEEWEDFMRYLKYSGSSHEDEYLKKKTQEGTE